MKRFLMGMAVLVMAAVAIADRLRADTFLGFRILQLDGAAVRWGPSGSTITVTYAFIREETRFANARNCGGMTAPDGLLAASKIDRNVFEQQVGAAFEMWEQVIDVNFEETQDVATAGILIGAQLEPAGHAFANVDYEPGAGDTRKIERSLICLNPKKQWKVGFGGSLAVYDILYTVAHEIGHAIGLDHPDSASQLMSFNYQETFRSLQPGDVTGAIRIYGARSTPTSGLEKPKKAITEARRQG